MHPVLLNEDVFVEILGHLSSTNYLEFPPRNGNSELERPRLSALNNLAVTCHAFTELALDERWRRIDYLTNLLRLLPSFKCFSNGTYYLDGPILDAHWDLLDKYARRIQYVLYVPQDADIDPSVFFTLALRGKKPLFPSLRQFFTMMYTEELLLFASPSLLRVHMMPLNNDDPFYPASWSFIDSTNNWECLILNFENEELEALGILSSRKDRDAS
ncbi:hypothetical protein BDZ97DRAFT_1921912 [Flammula alnicola]|nr:hypothetical protein BDZ97DRAFT_1921912 [Flammula alnicola]